MEARRKGGRRRTRVENDREIKRYGEGGEEMYREVDGGHGVEGEHGHGHSTIDGLGKAHGYSPRC